ncbi:MAG: hypothetical protein ACT4N4_12070 [Rhodospirillales bacterium]
MKETAPRSRRRPDGVDTVLRNHFQLETSMCVPGERVRETLWRSGIANLQAEFTRVFAGRVARACAASNARNLYTKRILWNARRRRRARRALRAALTPLAAR